MHCSPLRSLRHVLGWLLASSIASATFAAAAATIERVVPQGEVRQVRQVQVRFSESVAKIGDLNQPAPFTITCAQPGAVGKGRWVDDRNWVFDFERDLGPGTACTATPEPSLKALSGTAVRGAPVYRFSTGGPAVLRTEPYGGTIDEDQTFYLYLNGAAKLETVAQNSFCTAEQMAEKIPVKLIDGNERAELIKRIEKRYSGAQKLDPANVVTLRCAQRLPPGAKATLSWGAGIAALSGVVTSRPQVFSYRVREQFKLAFTCERENANAPCNPIQPIRLTFNAQVSRALADGIRLKTPEGERKPFWSREDTEGTASQAEFKGPFPEEGELTVTLPPNFTDDLGRAPVNVAMFPLKSKTAAFPPLVKFPASFGLLERYPGSGGPLLPVTLRNVEPSVKGKVLESRVSIASSGIPMKDLVVREDREVLQWLKTLAQSDDREGPNSREVSLLNGAKGAVGTAVPKAHGERAFEVVGIPLSKPGFHVVELESERLGASLLGKTAPMYVRTGVLVTNLAVHFKWGREVSAVWVTTLDGAKPVADAAVRLSNCNGELVWEGKSDAGGAARIAKSLPENAEACANAAAPYIVSARHGDDYSFVLSSWSNGIEAWRFKVNSSGARGGEGGERGTQSTHTIFDRTLLRAGETVSMKHIIRAESLNGLAYLPPDQLPNRIKIRHDGSDESVTLPVKFNARGIATSSWPIPKEAKLGSYEVQFLRVKEVRTPAAARRTAHPAESDENGEGGLTWYSGRFSVAEFRLPVYSGAVTAPKEPLVAVKEVPLNLSLNYINGGAAAGQAISITSMIRPRSVDYPDYPGFTFAAPREDQIMQGEEGSESPLRTNTARIEKVLVDKAQTKLDDKGAVQFMVKDIPKIVLPHELRTEMTFRDPNGETQTISSSAPLWAAALSLGIQTEEWAQVKKRANVQVVALDLKGKPAANVSVAIKGQIKQVFSHRKRTVGGFYAYDNKTEIKDLGTLCSGTSDARGLVLCTLEITESGNIELVAQAKDANGNAASTATSLWVAGSGEWWFAQDNADRMDVLPEKRRYSVGETAKFQVRSPFRQATAWLAVEREGVVETLTVPLTGKDPVLTLQIKPEYAPNVFVSVLAVRGRLREVPWYSVFQWGWKAPVEWYHEWQDWRKFEAENNGKVTTALVDLAKPAFKFGVSEIQVGTDGFKLGVTVKADRDTYQTREVAKVKVRVTLPDGKPAPAGSEIALAAVDQALLELQPNGSWDLLDSLIKRRGYGVETATAQMQVIGKRHFGKKALPAGGGGGRTSARELFETLLVWKPDVKLDANGEATIDVPLNDALTSFKIVAVADVDTSLFGVGSTSIRATKDLQLISGLPPLVREGDKFRAGITLRNTTTRAMQVEAKADVPGLAKPLLAQIIQLPANGAQEVLWEVTVPEAVTRLDWTLSAVEKAGGKPANDAMKVAQKVVTPVPLTVQQATISQLDKTYAVAVTTPPDALPGRSRITVNLAPKISGSLDGVQRYFEQYPFICLEQKTSKAVGMQSKELWAEVAKIIGNYLDADGLAKYFPTETGQGYDSLTAYILTVAHETGFAVPPEAKERMEAGLIAFIEGRIERKFWSPKKDLDVRKLAAIEALSRSNKARPALLQSIEIAPNVWPTGAVLDWLSILQRMKDAPPQFKRAERMAEAEQVLRARMTMSGTRLGFSTEAEDNWWWLMVSGDLNAAKLIATINDSPAWKDDMPRLVNGLVSRQQRGAWSTTTANIWGQIALTKFSTRFESERVAGVTTAGFDEGGTLKNSAALNWGREATGGKLELPYAFARDSQVRVNHEGSGRPWLTLSSLAAIPLKAPVTAGYRITKTLNPVEQKVKGAYTRGDLWRVKVEVEAQADYTWVVVNDPVPAGSTILGSGLQRDAQSATQGEQRSGNASLAFEERSFEAFRAYYEFAPKGKFTIEYTMRLNQDGEFLLPPTRVEAMYAPEQFGMQPNAVMVVKP